MNKTTRKDAVNWFEPFKDTEGNQVGLHSMV